MNSRRGDPPMTPRRWASRVLLIWLGFVLPGCGGSEKGEVVVYTAVDRAIAEPVFRAFTKRTGIRVVAKYPEDSPGRQGWIAAIQQEQRPRADVFWDDAMLGAVLLARQKLLGQYRSSLSHAIPEPYRDPEGRWCAMALEPRVLIVNNVLIPAGREPASLAELVEPAEPESPGQSDRMATFRRWRQRNRDIRQQNPQVQALLGLAGPGSDMAVTHLACLFAAVGSERTKRLLLGLKKAGFICIVADDAEVARRVADGQLAMGLTSGSEFVRLRESGRDVRVAYVGVREQKSRTLFVPHSVGILQGCQRPDAARQLVDFLLSPEASDLLAKGPGALVPLGGDVAFVPRLRGPRDVPSLKVDFRKAAEFRDDAAQFVRQRLAR